MDRASLSAAEAWGAAERRQLVRLCAAITRDRVAAEDLAQETLLEAWRSKHKLHDPSGRDRWLAAIARNVCLRSRRKHGRDLALERNVVADPPTAETRDAESRGTDLAEALSRLTPLTREVLLRRHVEDLPHAEIARRTGLSADAVSMRLSRGATELRRLLDDGITDGSTGWRATRVWCAQCGVRRLELRRDARSVAFRCRSCNDDVSSAFDLTTPTFARLLGDLVQPAAILARAADWSNAYFAGGAGSVACCRCEGAVVLRRSDKNGRDGLLGLCRSCGETTSSSAEGLAQATVGVRRLRRRHPRTRVVRRFVVEHEGLPAIVIRFAPPTAAEAVDVVLARDTLRLLTPA